jgi:uncharacterized membrane protein
MIPLIVLIFATAGARLAGKLGLRPFRDWPGAVRAGLAVMFVFTAVAHFNSMRADLIAMVPPSLPVPGLLVTLTGVSEILGAIGLLVPSTRRAAALALMVFLVAVLPANVYAATSGATLGGEPVTPLVPRVALQVLFFVLVWWAGFRHGGAAS